MKLTMSFSVPTSILMFLWHFALTACPLIWNVKGMHDNNYNAESNALFSDRVCRVEPTTTTTSH
jgi:hypothetical protein